MSNNTNNTVDKIQCASNTKQINRLLPDEMAIVSSGRRLWVVTDSGHAQGFPESFEDARSRAARLIAY